jgi:hypothetical protein
LTKKAQKATAARAQAAKFQRKMAQVDILEISLDSAIEQSESDDIHDSDIECDEMWVMVQEMR